MSSRAGSWRSGEEVVVEAEVDAEVERYVSASWAVVRAEAGSPVCREAVAASRRDWACCGLKGGVVGAVVRFGVGFEALAFAFARRARLSDCVVRVFAMVAAPFDTLVSALR